MTESNFDVGPGDPVHSEAHFKYSPYSESKDKQETGIGRLFEKINQFFKKKPQEDLQLLGRIQGMASSVDALAERLSSIRKELEEDIDPSLVNLIEGVIDPLVREVERTKVLLRKDAEDRQDRNLQKCADWIEKAALWVEICSKSQNKEVIYQAVIENTINEFKQIVDRDLKIIDDYSKYLFNTIEKEDHRQEIQAQCSKEITAHLLALNDLKEAKYEIDFSNIGSWRAEIDNRREMHFSAALHIIDAHMMSVEQPPPGIHEEVHHIEILHRLSALEEKISLLGGQISGGKKISGQAEKIREIHFSSLEREAHDLNGDLRLSQEQADRVQILLHRLTAIRKKFTDIYPL